MQVCKKAVFRSALIIAFGSFAAGQALADGGPEDGSESKWGIGLMLGAETMPYKGYSSKTEVWPMLSYENKWVRVAGPGVDLKLGNTGAFSYELTARYSDSGYQASDASEFDGMDDRDGGVWLGARVNWQNELVNVHAELLGDASGNSDGQQFRLSFDRRFQSGAYTLVPRIALNWQDKNYVDYYYGVKESEARADRSAYTGASGVSSELGMRMNYAVDAKQTVFLDLSATALPSSIKDSPLVDSSTKSAIRFGYVYRF